MIIERDSTDRSSPELFQRESSSSNCQWGTGILGYIAITNRLRILEA